MNHLLAKYLSCAAALSAVPLLLAGPAAADPANVIYFRFAGFDCTATDDGVLGCDLPAGTTMDTPLISGSANGPTVTTEVREIVMDGPGLPMHVGSGAGSPHTLPGGNPAPVYVGDPGYYNRLEGTSVVCGAFHAGPATCYSGKHGFGVTPTESGSKITIS